MLERQRQGDYWSSLTSQSSRVGELQVQWKILHQNLRWETTGEDNRINFWPLHEHRYTCTWTQTTYTKNNKPNTCNKLVSNGEIETVMHCWWNCKNGATMWKTVWQLLKSLNTDWPHDLEIPQLAITKNTEYIYPQALMSKYSQQHDLQ